MGSLVNVGEYVVIVSQATGLPKIAEGTEAVAKKKKSPASTFKVLLAWAGLEEGVVTPNTKHRVTDKHVPETPREVTLHEAMYYSSNDYFVWLGEKIGKKKLTAYITKSGFVSSEVPSEWLGGAWNSVTKGGNLEVTAFEQHAFMRKVMDGSLTSSQKIQADLEKVMRWPSSDASVALYGKTGVWGGAVWFNGFGVKGGEKKVVTVLYEGRLPLRPKAIASFYSQFGQSPLAPKGLFDSN